MSTEQYYEGMDFAQLLDINLLFEFMNDSNVELSKNSDKLKSLFTQVKEYDLITNIASCAIKPRFGKWKSKNRHKYCKDISRSINLALGLSGFFLSNFGLILPNLGNFLKAMSRN